MPPDTEYARRNTLVIVWRVTEACDLGCPFCAYSRHLRRPRGYANPDQILALGALLSQYAAAYSRDILVSWLGGEPLRWPPLFDLAHIFKHAYGLRLSATTNGTALNSPAVRQAIVADFDELTLSLDGLGAVHDSLRDAPGLFEQLRANIAVLCELKAQRNSGLRLRGNTILMRDNIHAFANLCHLLADWGIEELTFNALGGRDRPEFYPDHCLLPEQMTEFRAALPALRAALAPRGLTLLGSDAYLDRLSASVINYQLPITNCSPGQSFLFINERGFLSPCSFTTQGYGIHLSELCSSEDLHRLPALFAQRQRHQTLTPCYDCPSTQVFGKFASSQNQFALIREIRGKNDH
jgi:MoaA/NifB/PqqE/SkfB family radical SAM enzyme